MKHSRTRFFVALAFLGLALITYEVARSVVARKSAAVAELQGQLDAKAQTATRVAAARAALAELAGDEVEVQSYFVSQADVVNFIDDLQARGQTLGADVSISSVAATTKSHPSLNISLAAKGPFDSVMRTVGSIEYAPYDLSVTALALAPGQAGGWVATMALVVGSAPAGATPAATAISTSTSTSATTTP